METKKRSLEKCDDDGNIMPLKRQNSEERTSPFIFPVHSDLSHIDKEFVRKAPFFVLKEVPRGKGYSYKSLDPPTNEALLRYFPSLFLPHFFLYSLHPQF